MSTLHANSAKDAIYRMVTLFQLYSNTNNLSFEIVTKLICQNIDIIIFMEDRKIKECIKLIGSEGNTPFIEYIEL